MFKLFSITSLVLVSMFVAQPVYAGTLTTSITDATTCTSGGGTVLLRLTGTTNAHAELPSQATAAYNTNVVCGNGVAGLGTSCSGTFATILKLSGLTNGHAEQNSLTNYANNACISVASGAVSVGYQATNCTGFDATIGSMSATTNAHVGNSAAYPAIQICATASGASPPAITTYANITETALNYAAACTGCGARIGGGAGFRQAVTITGTTFGADPGVANRSTATNNIKIGTHQIANANVTAWSATSITFLTDSAIAGDTDTDWGTVFGGASALKVTAGGAASAGVNFYVFPQVTSVTQPAGFAADTAREYNAADTDGVITLNGTRFGSSQGTGTATVVAQSATINSWTNTAIALQVPPAIVDTTNTGSISMTQGTGGNSKAHTYANTLRVLPRILSFTPSSTSEGSAVTVTGNHFCQSGTCPVAFTAGDKVTFSVGVVAVTFTSWSATAIATVVPTGAVTGNVVVTSATSYTSNGSSLTVLSNTPAPPTSMSQWKNAGFTQAIAVGGSASTTPIYLTMTMSVPGISGGTLYSQIEYKPIGTPFVCTGVAVCASDALQGPAGFAGPGPVDCTVSNCAISIIPTDNVYHWQARVKHTKSAVDYYSAWVSFDNVNPETSTDFQIDTTGPVITSVSSGTPGTNSATITWNTLGEVSTTQIQYNTTGTFVADCATNNDCTTLDITPVNSHTPPALTNLNSGTIYYYRARSRDNAGNETIDANNLFTTQSVNQPAKTARFHIAGKTSVVTSGVPLSQAFSVVMPENATSTKSIYVEIKGIYTAGATSKDIVVQVNAETAKTYTVPASSTSYFKIMHQVANIAVDPSTNTLTITPQANTSLNILSADIYVNYAYTP